MSNAESEGTKAVLGFCCGAVVLTRFCPSCGTQPESPAVRILNRLFDALRSAKEHLRRSEHWCKQPLDGSPKQEERRAASLAKWQARVKCAEADLAFVGRLVEEGRLV